MYLYKKDYIMDDDRIQIIKGTTKREEAIHKHEFIHVELPCVADR